MNKKYTEKNFHFFSCNFFILSNTFCFTLFFFKNNKRFYTYNDLVLPFVVIVYKDQVHAFKANFGIKEKLDSFEMHFSRLISVWM